MKWCDETGLDVWSDHYENVSYNEGWRVANYGGTRHFEFVIKREDGPYGSRPIFANDGVAWDFVVGRALAGSEMHKQALAIVDPIERQNIENRVGALTLAAAMQTTTTVGET